jgi:hypothetical protein
MSICDSVFSKSNAPIRWTCCQALESGIFKASSAHLLERVDHRCGVRVPGVSQPPAYANKPAIPASTAPIAAKRMMRLVFGNSARGV